MALTHPSPLIPETTPLHWARLLALVFAPFAAGYFLSYLLRSVNAVIAPDLIAEMNLTPADLGLMTAAYFLVFGGFQLPLGILLDRFGPRRVEASLLVIAAMGTALFALSYQKETLFLARALIGLGVSACLMAALKAIHLWYPPERWPLMTGLFMMIGGLGALAATAPAQSLLPWLGWRGLFWGLSAGCALTALAIFIFVPERRDDAPPHSRLGEQIKGIEHIYRDRFFWRIAPLCILVVAAGLAIQGLWAGTWLRDVANLGREAAADYLFVLALFLAMGFGLGGFVTQALMRLGISQMTIMGANAGLFGVSLGLIALGVGADGGLLGYAVWAAFGYFSNVSINAFALLAGHFPRSHSGRASTAMNMPMFLGAFALQWLTGKIIGLWPQSPDGGYAPEGYAVSFGLYAAAIALAFLWFAWPRSNSLGRG